MLFAIGCQLCVLAAGMCIPLVVGFAAAERDWHGFMASAILTFVAGSLMVLGTRGTTGPIQLRGAFLLTTSSWLAATLFGALPFQLGPYNLSFTDAVFETVSGLTTTGATVITGLDTAPPGLLLWRSILHWLGGVGIIVMAILIFPFLRLGGMQLFRAESSDRTAKLLPSMTAITQQIVLVYLVLTIACIMTLVAVGMGTFDAINHAFAALGTGGFSTKDASIGAFKSPSIEWVLTIFMALASLPFLRFVALLNGRPGLLFKDSQVATFLGIALVAILALTIWLMAGLDRPFADALRAASFNTVSVLSTTGFFSDDYSLWGPPAVTLFLALTVMGGCTGSSAGGLKTFRFEILWTAARVYLVQLFEPNRVVRLRYAGQPIGPDIVFAVLSFVFFFMGAWGLITVALGALGLDLVTAVSAAAGTLANVGPGLGPIVGPGGSYKSLSDPVKWVLSLAMLLGRLEFFTILVLLHPAFWRR